MNSTQQTNSTSSRQDPYEGSAHDVLAFAREVTVVCRELLRSGFVLPIGIAKSWIQDSGMDPIWSEKRLYELLGDVVLNCFNQLGPVYGKLGQTLLSRLDPDSQKWAHKLRLDRIQNAWPALPFSQIEEILDTEIPHWHQEFIVEPHPLGVASMAQVHAAVDEQGREWVIKVIKPDSRRRLEATLNALQQILTMAKPLRRNALKAKSLSELEDLMRSLRREIELDLEKSNLDRMRRLLEEKKQKVLRLPATYDAFCTENVIVMERFRGIPLGDVVSRRVELSDEQRKKLAKHLLQELLVQVFEIGVFHGDPHAGNLMLLDDGCVGIFDWGLTGELREHDRLHISGILKALLMVDMQRLVDVLVDMAEQSEVAVDRADVEHEIRRVAQLIDAHKAAGTKPSMEELLEASLSGATVLGIPVPDGLLLMAKSLLTIEGLARGIDPEVSFARAAGPVLLKAARPTLGEMLSLGRRLPHILKKAFVD